MSLRTDIERVQRELKWRVTPSWWWCDKCQEGETSRKSLWRQAVICDQCGKKMRNLDRLFRTLVDLVHETAFRQSLRQK